MIFCNVLASSTVSRMKRPDSLTDLLCPRRRR